MRQGDPPPSRARFVLAGWLCALSAVLFLDRVCIGQAAQDIQADLGLSNRELGYVFMAFTIAYGLFEVPTGRLGDRIGARAVLARVVVWCSAFTALTGATFGLWSLLVVRFLFGAGEAGAYPNTARVLSRWFPAAERGRVTGLMLTCAQLGGAAAPALTAALVWLVGWRLAFVAFGLVGVVWAVGFWLWFRDDPADHPRVNATELALIRAGTNAGRPHGSIPWRAVSRAPGVWLLAAIIMCSSFNSYLYFSWFSKYLQDGRGVAKGDAGLLTSLVLLGGAAGMMAGGVLADRVSRTADRVRARRRFGAVAYMTSAAALTAATAADSPLLLAALVAVGYLALQSTLPTWWAAAIEQSGRNVGAVFGMLNTCGILAGVASQGFVGWFTQHQADAGVTGRGQWDPILWVYVGVLLAGAAGWALYRYRPLDDDPEPQH
ncbi:MAG: MFS transporter [Gemmataceae bacterium]